MKSSTLLKLFEDVDIEEGKTFSIELSDAEIQTIGYKAFIDLAQLFFMKMLTPTVKDTKIVLSFYKLKQTTSFHKSKDTNEKYGVDSEFFLIDKTTQFSFLYHYKQALKFINIKDKQNILNLGVNRGDEFKVIKDMLHPKSTSSNSITAHVDEFSSKKLLGIDYSSSIIEYAKDDFKDENIEFLCHDINKLYELSIGRFDLIISIGTLQSSNISFNATFMNIYQNYLEKDGAIILGFPNCRWFDGEMIYGAKAPNYSFSEMSLVLKDIHFCKKYLQQKGYRVIITGKDYLFLTARKITRFDQE